MALEYSNFLWAMGSTAAAGTAVWIAGASVASGGAGNYVYTLDSALAADQCCCLANARAAAPAADLTPTWVQTSPTVKTLTWTAAGVATATAHDWVILAAPLS